ncbi:hypothetical protein [Vibrio splendidus]|uniref:hypothetical protein n=1 Tax=Vibrio splendidus TaxID=29497 RepID=UPI0010565831|nr:hypothetical protein [Vibrio splendidus]
MDDDIDLGKVLNNPRFWEDSDVSGPFMFSERKNFAFYLMKVRSLLFAETMQIRALKSDFLGDELKNVTPQMPLGYYENYLSKLSSSGVSGEIHSSIWAINYLRADLLLLSKQMKKTGEG